MNEVMENINNAISTDAVEQAIEVVASAPKVKWQNIGGIIGIVGAVGTIGYCVYRYFAKKIEAQEDDLDAVDNVEQAHRDFLDEEKFDEA